MGVDLSEKMLALARGLHTPAPKHAPVYSRLVAADLLTLRAEALLPAAAAEAGEAAAFELVAAADVLVYFGELGALLQAFAAVTAEGGDLALSNPNPNPNPNPSPSPNPIPNPNPTQAATSSSRASARPRRRRRTDGAYAPRAASRTRSRTCCRRPPPPATRC